MNIRRFTEEAGFDDEEMKSQYEIPNLMGEFEIDSPTLRPFYTHSDKIIKKPDSLADNINQAKYHFEHGLKMAILDRDTTGDWDGAILELDKAIDLNPDFVKAYHYRAVIHS
jgi:hypothetical protein